MFDTAQVKLRPRLASTLALTATLPPRTAADWSRMQMRVAQQSQPFVNRQAVNADRTRERAWKAWIDSGQSHAIK